MLKTFLSALLLSAAMTAAAQQTAYRYWTDNDASTLRQGRAAEGPFSVGADLGRLSPGVHALHLQVSRDGHAWSAPLTRYFCVAAPQPQPTACRYWFDNDVSTLHNLTGLEPTVSVDLRGLKAGLHALHFQTVTDGIGPSAVLTRYFYLKDDPADELTLTAWFDADRSQTQAFTYTGDDITLTTDQLRRGLHTVTAELRNSQGDLLAADSLEFEVVRYKTIRLTGFATTYCADDDLDFTSVEGLRAYIIAGFNRHSYEVTALRINDAPAFEGLYIEGEPGDYRVRCSDSYSVYANLLRGTTESLLVRPVEEGYVNYVLSPDADTATFVPLTRPTYVEPSTAWLHLPAPADRSRPLRIVYGDEPDAIRSVTSPDAPAAVYTLSGRRLPSPSRGAMPKGVYIVDGKKVVVD